MKAMRDVWGDKLVELGATDPRTVVLDGDLGNSTKVDKFAKAHPERFFQMGIAEQNLVGAAAGLAGVGYVPWTSSFAVFFTHRAIDPIRMLVAQSHANVKIVGSYSGLLIGAVGKTHLDVQDLAIMRAMPDITVLSPADETELLAMMDWAQAYDGPVYLRIVRDAVPDVFGADYTFTPGAVYRLREGTDVAMVSTGPQISRVLAAASPARRTRGRRDRGARRRASSRWTRMLCATASPATTSSSPWRSIRSWAVSAVWSRRLSPQRARRRASNASESTTSGVSQPETTSCSTSTVCPRS